MTAISDEDLQSLAAKLDALDLSEAEQAALDGVLERAEAYEPEVEGFSASRYYYTGQAASGAMLSGMSLKLGGSLGFVTRPSLGYGDPLDPTKGGGGGPGKPPPP